MRAGPPYLARGVVGDLTGLVVLAIPLVTQRRRARYEALACLGAIGLVHAARARWATRVPTAAWWAAVTFALAAYLDLRARSFAETAPEPGSARSAGIELRSAEPAPRVRSEGQASDAIRAAPRKTMRVPQPEADLGQGEDADEASRAGEPLERVPPRFGSALPPPDVPGGGHGTENTVPDQDHRQ